MNSLPVGLAGLVDGTMFGWSMRGGELRLGQEPLPEARVLGQPGRQQLQRHLPLQPQILGQIDDAHPTPAQHRLQPIAGEVAADWGVVGDGQGDRQSV